MAASKYVTIHRDGDGIQVAGEDTEPVERFRDIKDDLRDRMPFEVTNEFVLNVLCDVYALHQEDPA